MNLSETFRSYGAQFNNKSLFYKPFAFKEQKLKHLSTLFLFHHRSPNIQTTLKNPKANELFELMNKEYTHIHEIGYRSMPEEMYLDWLVSLKTERAKYEDTRMSK